jgi:hypothetical protein
VVVEGGWHSADSIMNASDCAARTALCNASSNSCAAAGKLQHCAGCPAQIVKSHLWSIYPPEPLTAEEAVLEQQQEAAEAARKVGSSCAGLLHIKPHHAVPAGRALARVRADCSGQVWCRFQLLHGSCGTELGLYVAPTAPVNRKVKQAQQLRTSQRGSRGCQCVQTAGQMTDMHGYHNMTAVMLTQAEEKKRKAELRKASKAAAKAAGASPSGRTSTAAAGVPLPLPQGARGTGGGAFASSPPAIAAAGTPATGAGIPGDLNIWTTAM